MLEHRFFSNCLDKALSDQLVDWLWLSLLWIEVGPDDSKFSDLCYSIIDETHAGSEFFCCSLQDCFKSTYTPWCRPWHPASPQPGSTLLLTSLPSLCHAVQGVKLCSKFFIYVLTKNTPNLQWLRPQSFTVSFHLKIQLLLVPWALECADPSALPPLLRLAVCPHCMRSCWSTGQHRVPRRCCYSTNHRQVLQGCFVTQRVRTQGKFTRAWAYVFFRMFQCKKMEVGRLCPGKQEGSLSHTPGETDLWIYLLLKGKLSYVTLNLLGLSSKRGLILQPLVSHNLSSLF